MASLEEISKKIEAEKLKRLEEQRLIEQQKIEELEKQRLFMIREREYYDNLYLYERIAVSNSVSSTSSAAGGSIKQLIEETPDYFTLQIDAQIGYSIGIYVVSPTSVTYDWGDGTIDETGSHTYNENRAYEIKISPTNITEIQMYSMSPLYSGPKFSEFRYLTELTNLAILISGTYTIEDGALDNCKKLEGLGFKFGGPSQLKKSMFNNLTSLKDYMVIYGQNVNSFESGVFEGTKLRNLYFYDTSFESTTLVDNFLIDLNNSNLPYLDYISIYTHRTANSNSAVESLGNKGVTVDVILDS